MTLFQRCRYIADMYVFSWLHLNTVSLNISTRQKIKFKMYRLHTLSVAIAKFEIDIEVCWSIQSFSSGIDTTETFYTLIRSEIFPDIIADISGHLISIWCFLNGPKFAIHVKWSMEIAIEIETKRYKDQTVHRISRNNAVLLMGLGTDPLFFFFEEK